MDRGIPPATISPLIKGARWGFLVVGILYGKARYNYLYKIEQKRLEELERTREQREAKAKFEKEKADKENMEELYRNLGLN